MTRLGREAKMNKTSLRRILMGGWMQLIGRTLGQYRIIEQIGAGGMATVYKAYQAGLDRFVAIKTLPPQHAQTPEYKERFFREAVSVA